MSSDVAMIPESIEVECYSGGRSDERPRLLKLRGKVHRVARLLGESVEEIGVSRRRFHRYRILTCDGLVMDVARYDEGWHLTRTTEPSR